MRTIVHHVPRFLSKNYMIPFYFQPVKAGFPSPADDFIEAKLDLNQFLVEHPASTFFMRVHGNSMSQVGIIEGDVLVVDRSVPVREGSIIIAIIEGELQVRKIIKRRGVVYAATDTSDKIDTSNEYAAEFEVWGVVKYVIHKT